MAIFTVCFGNDWDSILSDEFQKEYYIKLRSFLKNEYASNTIYPPANDIFNALKFTAYKDVKVVIIGQDPYHGPNQAHGLAFSVQPGIDIPPSLLNMYKEIKNEFGYEIPDTGCLIPWAKQGVLLLNTVLTVRAGQANSHKGMGWERFTDRVIELLNQRDEPIVFLLWGKNAGDKENLITNPIHVIMKAPHPSPLSASRGFFGCGHFIKANQELILSGFDPVDWSIKNN